MHTTTNVYIHVYLYKCVSYIMNNVLIFYCSNSPWFNVQNSNENPTIRNIYLVFKRILEVKTQFLMTF